MPELSGQSRIALAIALSLLIHTVLLFGPKLVVPAPVEVLLPPLMAKLEPLPVIRAAAKPETRPASKPRHSKVLKPASVAQQVEPAPAEEQGPVTPSAPLATAATEEEPAAVVDSPPAESTPAHPLPKHAQLTFMVYKGTDFTIGQASHRLEIGDDQSYHLRADVKTIGLVSLFKTFVMNQQSHGTATAQGLRPDEFSEGRVSDRGNQALTASFDWKGRQLLFSSGENTALPDQAQDMLSFLYQLSQLPLDQPVITMYISNGRKLERYELEVGSEEYILTRNGKMRALPLRKKHAQGEEGLEIWLGLEYRLLPVKIRQLDKNGEIGGQMVISDIRVSEE
ncbi:MAG: DUF3108 domain-containing protein [Gallionella sp.]|nr:DUF3108 domain-containing protein [Gallionella sp.]